MLLCALFAAAAFASNQRLLLALKGQRETTAAAMVMQWRMEMFRAAGFTNVASHDYVMNNILTVRTSSSGGTTIDPFSMLGGISESFTISLPDGSSPRQMSWDAAHSSGYDVTSADLSSASLLKVNVSETWTSADGRQRTRQISTICGVGNTGVSFTP